MGGLLEGKPFELVVNVVGLEEGRFAGPGSQCWKIPGPDDFLLDIALQIKLYKTHIYKLTSLEAMGT